MPRLYDDEVDAFPQRTTEQTLTLLPRSVMMPATNYL